MRRLLLPLAIVVAIASAYLAPALAEGRLIAPAEGYAFYMPMRLMVAASLRMGELPFWNPYSFSGLPLLAALQGGVFFPGTWLFLLLPAVWAFNLNVLAALALAGSGCVMFLNALGLTRGPALLGGVTFMLGGFMAGHFEHITMLQSAAFVPWLLWVIERHRTSGRSRYAMAGCLMLALQVLAGHPQMVAHGLALALPYAFYRGWSLDAGRRVAFAANIGAMVTLGIGLCALQLLPALDLIAMSQRRSIPYETLVIDGLSWRQLPTLLFPFLYGSAVSPLFATPYWGPGTWMFGHYGYVGLAPVVLACAAAMRAWREPRVAFWVLAAGFSLWLALGDSTPLYRLWASLPVFSSMQNPNRHLLEFDLAMAVLAAYGLQGLLDAPQAERRRLRTSLGVIGVLVLGGLAAVTMWGPPLAARLQPYVPHVDMASALRGWQPAFWTPALWWGLSAVLLVWLVRHPRPALQGALIALVTADLFMFGFHQGWWQFSPRWPAELGYRPGVDWSSGRAVTLPAAHYPYFAGLERVRALRYPLITALEGLPTVNGYDAFLVERYARLAGTQTFGLVNDHELYFAPDHRAHDVLALGTLHLEPRVAAQPFWQTQLASDRWAREPDRDGLVTLKNRRGLPRAWRVTTARVLTPAQVDRAIAGESAFDPRSTALLESPGSRSVYAAGTAAAETLSLNRIRVKTDGPGAGLVLVSESYDPGWRAFDGERALPVHRAQGLIMAIEVPAGARVVDMRYEPVRWRQGLALSGLSMAALLGWLALGARRRRRQARCADARVTPSSTTR